MVAQKNRMVPKNKKWFQKTRWPHRNRKVFSQKRIQPENVSSETGQKKPARKLFKPFVSPKNGPPKKWKNDNKNKDINKKK